MKTLNKVGAFFWQYFDLMGGATSVILGIVALFGNVTHSTKYTTALVAYCSLWVVVIKLFIRHHQKKVALETKRTTDIGLKDDEITSLRNEILKLKEVKSLGINLVSTGPVPDLKWNSANEQEKTVDVLAEISNPNQAVSGIKFKLISISPLMYKWTPPSIQGSQYTRSLMDLRLNEFEFKFKDPNENTINQGDTGLIPVFQVMKRGNEVVMWIKGTDRANQGAGQYVTAGSHTVVVQVTGIGVDPTVTKFNVTFTHDKILVTIAKLN